MFKAISKKTALATCLVLGVSYGANAQNVDPYEDYKFSCSSPSSFFDTSDSECESFEVVYLEDNLQELNSQPSQDEIAQSRRRRRTGKYYAGFTGGAFFASGDVRDEIELLDFIPISSIGYGTAFGGSIFGGMKINKILNAELELFLGFGGLDTDDANDGISTYLKDEIGFEEDVLKIEFDGDYSAVALYVSPKFEFPLSRSGKITVFISPGIGLSQTTVTTENKITGSFAERFIEIIEDPEGEDFGSTPESTEAGQALAKNLGEEVDDSQTGISFQVKAGATFGISRNVSLVAQTRYASLPTEDGIDTLNLFSAEAGLKFKF